MHRLLSHAFQSKIGGVDGDALDASRLGRERSEDDEEVNRAEVLPLLIDDGDAAGGVSGGHVVRVSAGAGEHLRDDALGFGLGGVAVGLVV